MDPRHHIELWGAALTAALLLALVLMVSSLAGRLAGHELEAAWICDDTRYTRLLPEGRDVVGAPVSPAPGCLR